MHSVIVPVALFIPTAMSMWYEYEDEDFHGELGFQHTIQSVVHEETNIVENADTVIEDSPVEVEDSELVDYTTEEPTENAEDIIGDLDVPVEDSDEYTEDTVSYTSSSQSHYTRDNCFVYFETERSYREHIDNDDNIRRDLSNVSFYAIPIY